MIFSGTFQILVLASVKLPKLCRRKLHCFVYPDLFPCNFTKPKWIDARMDKCSSSVLSFSNHFYHTYMYKGGVEKWINMHVCTPDGLLNGLNAQILIYSFQHKSYVFTIFTRTTIVVITEGIINVCFFNKNLKDFNNWFLKPC